MCYYWNKGSLSVFPTTCMYLISVKNNMTTWKVIVDLMVPFFSQTFLEFVSNHSVETSLQEAIKQNIHNLLVGHKIFFLSQPTLLSLN